MKKFHQAWLTAKTVQTRSTGTA